MNSTTPRSIRWKTGCILLTSLVIVDAGFYLALADNRTFQIMAMWGLTVLSALIMLAWWVFASGASWAGKAKGIVGVGILGGIISMTLRVDGFMGDMFPILAFRWNATPEERAAEYRNQNTSDETQIASLSAAYEPGPRDWPDFRGPDRNGEVQAVFKNSELDWKSNAPEMLWKIPIGLGWGSVCAVDQTIFTLEQRGAEEVLSAYSMEDGKEIWSASHEVRFSEQMGGDGPRTTPVFHQGKVYAFGATGWLSAHDASDGTVVWSRNILKENAASNLTWGMSSTPVIYQDMLIAAPGGPEGEQVQAYRLEDGEIIWKSGNGGASYASPVIRSLGEKDWALVFLADGLHALDPMTGEAGWSFAWSNNPKVNAVVPYVNGMEVLISCGYGVGTAYFEVKKNQDTGEWSTEEIWSSVRLKSKFNDFFVHEGMIYGLDEGRLTCLELESGRRQWKGDSYGYGQMLKIGNRLLILSESGEVALVALDPEEFIEITRFEAIQGKTWNHPAVAQGKLIVRNDREMACFDLNLDYNLSDSDNSAVAALSTK